MADNQGRVEMSTQVVTAEGLVIVVTVSAGSALAAKAELDKAVAALRGVTPAFSGGGGGPG